MTSGWEDVGLLKILAVEFCDGHIDRCCMAITTEKDRCRHSEELNGVSTLLWRYWLRRSYDVIYGVLYFDVEMWRLLRLIECRRGTKDEKLLLARPETSSTV